MTNQVKVEKIIGASDAIYYQRLWATLDTTEGPEDAISQMDDRETVRRKKAQLQRKYALRRQRLLYIQATMQSNGWRLLELAAMDTIEHIEKVRVWDALAKGDQEELNNCRIERAGIMTWFNLFASLTNNLAKVNRLVEVYSSDTDDASQLFTALDAIEDGEPNG